MVWYSMNNMSRLMNMFQILRGDVRHLPPVIIFTVLSTAVYNFGWGFADPFMSIYFAEFSYDYAMIGWLQTLTMVVSVAMLVPVGDLLDRVNHQWLMIGAKIGYAVVGLLYFCAGEWHSVPLLIAARILNGALIPFVWTSAVATIRDYSTKKNASLAYGFYITASQLAFCFGLAIALWVVWKFPIHYIFIPVIFFPVISILFNRHQKDRHAEPLGQALKDIIFTDKLFFRFLHELKHFSRELWAMYGLLFLLAIINMIAITYVSLYAISRGFTFVETGVLLLVMTLPYFFSFLSAELADRTERIRNTVIGIAISTIALFCFAIGVRSDWQIFASGFILVVGYAIALPSVGSMIDVMTPKKVNGRGAALTDMMFFMSVVCFAPIVGWLIDRGGWEYMFLSAACFFVIVLIWTLWLRYQFRKKNVAYHKQHPNAKNNPYII